MMAGTPQAHFDSGISSRIGNGAALFRDQMAVRIRLGIAQLGRHAIFEFLRNEVLQALGFFVNFVPGVVQDIVQEAFEQAVMAENFKARILPAGVRRTPWCFSYLTKEGRCAASFCSMPVTDAARTPNCAPGRCWSRALQPARSVPGWP